MAEKEDQHQKNVPDKDSASSPGKKKTKTDEASASMATAVPTKPLSPRDLLVPASPPKFINLEDIMRMANGVTDMTLAHEIAVGNDFKFHHAPPPPEDSIEHKVREVMHKAFWDVLEEKLREDPPDYSHALVLLLEVKENLLELLLPQHQRLRENIEEVLDMNLIEQKADHGALDIDYYANYIIGNMARLCAPVRDDEIAALKQLSGIVPIYKEIFRILNLMKLDMVNFTIDAVRPYVQQHSVAYEKDKFKELLKTQQENGIDGLLFTKAWLSRSAAKVRSQGASASALSSTASASSDSASPVAESSSSQSPVSDRKQYKEIMNAAYMELLEWDEHDVFPETLLIDQQRFLDLRNKVGWLVLVSSILIVTYNTVGEAIAGIAELKKKLKMHIDILTNGVTESQLPEAMASVAEQVNKEVNKCLEEHTLRRMTSEQEKLLKGQIMAIIAPDNTIFKLMKSRLFAFVATILANPQGKDLQIPSGFSAVSEEVSQACGQFVRLIAYNQAVFGSHYADLINTILSTL